MGWYSRGIVRRLLTNDPASDASQDVARALHVPLVRMCDLFLKTTTSGKQLMFPGLCSEKLLLYIQYASVELGNSPACVRRNLVS